MPSVTRFNVTPVKATALHNPDEVRFEEHGAVGNREFFFLDEDGKLFGGHQFGTLVRIVSAYEAGTDSLTLTFPDGTVTEGPAAGSGAPLTVNFWGRPVDALVVEGPWTEPLSSFAGQSLRVARVSEPGAGNDVRAVTLVSLASVEELSRQGGREEPVDARRFRMTVEIDGVAPHEEDAWEGREVRIGEAVLEIEAPVPRCVVTDLDPATGERDFPTLATIKRYRGVSAEGDLPFGVYAAVVRPGIARVGDTLGLR
jgi:uncharacterized protein